MSFHNSGSGYKGFGRLQLCEGRTESAAARFGKSSQLVGMMALRRRASWHIAPFDTPLDPLGRPSYDPTWQHYRRDPPRRSRRAPRGGSLSGRLRPPGERPQPLQPRQRRLHPQPTWQHYRRDPPRRSRRAPRGGSLSGRLRPPGERPQPLQPRQRRLHPQTRRPAPVAPQVRRHRHSHRRRRRTRRLSRRGGQFGPGPRQGRQSPGRAAERDRKPAHGRAQGRKLR